MTGSSGLIGSQAVEFYDSRGHEVHDIDNSMRNCSSRDKGDSRWICSGLSRRPSLSRPRKWTSVIACAAGLAAVQELRPSDTLRAQPLHARSEHYGRGVLDRPLHAFPVRCFQGRRGCHGSGKCPDRSVSRGGDLAAMKALFLTKLTETGTKRGCAMLVRYRCAATRVKTHKSQKSLRPSRFHVPGSLERKQKERVGSTAYDL
jgi:NAD dependent epimerase/dehydratase family